MWWGAKFQFKMSMLATSIFSSEEEKATSMGSDASYRQDWQVHNAPHRAPEKKTFRKNPETFREKSKNYQVEICSYRTAVSKDLNI